MYRKKNSIAAHSRELGHVCTHQIKSRVFLEVSRAVGAQISVYLEFLKRAATAPPVERYPRK